jgi:phenylacetate-coenzyme A ligase PaaK-like adenylate-forming protein
MLDNAYRQAAFIAEALRDERRSAADAQRMQDARLRATVHHAWANSRFYRQKLERAGLRPEDIRTTADLVYLPPTTKAELQALPDGFARARDFTGGNTVRESTSGSSGRTLQIDHSPAAYDRYFAFAFRHLTEIGYRPWHRVAYTAYDPLVSLPWERFGLGMRQQVDLRQRDPKSYIEALLRIRPDVITAYPSILRLVIRSATASEIERIRPRAIHLHSELLTDSIRAEVRQAFGCDCFDDYSTFEFHHVAYECRQHAYHIAADNVVVEFLRDGRPVAAGQQGEILLTGLTNRAMPLLRYAIGDVGAAGIDPCACGRGFPTMQLLQGRVDDFIVLPSGRCFSPRMVNPAFENLPGILEHVLVQEAPDWIVAHLNLRDEHRSTAPDLVERALRELFGEPIRLDVRLTTGLERGRTGKLRSIVSRVSRVG